MEWKSLPPAEMHDENGFEIFKNFMNFLKVFQDPCFERFHEIFQAKIFIEILQHYTQLSAYHGHWTLN